MLECANIFLKKDRGTIKMFNKMIMIFKIFDVWKKCF